MLKTIISSYSANLGRASLYLGRATLFLVASMLMLGLLALAPAKPAAADPPAVAGVTWTPTFIDQFSGTTLDTSKWDSGYSWINTSDQSVGSPSHDYFGANGDVAGYPYYGNTTFPAVTVDANGLSLRSARENYTDNRGVTHSYTSGAVQTDRSFAQLYGYFEADFTVATEKGLDPAFWLYTRDANGQNLPGINELDVVEVPSAPWYNGFIDFNGDLLSNNVHNATNLQGNTAFIPYGSPLGAASHKYGMDWEPGTVTFYLDGNVIRSLTYTPVSGQRPMFMILNEELENDINPALNGGTGNWYGNPDSLATYQTVFAHARSVKAWTRSAEAPYPSLPSFPGTVQAANYDTGGPGISYNQVRPGYPQYYYNRPDNNGAAFSNSADGSTPDGITSASKGQWYKYTVNVATSGTYTLSFAINTNNHANAQGYGVFPYGGQIHLEDWNTATATGTNITPNLPWLNSPQTSGTWWPLTVTNPTPVLLTAGTHVFRWVQDFQDYNDDFNLYSITATLVQADNGPYSGPHNLPGTVQCEDYDLGGQGVSYNIYGANGGNPGTVYRSDNNGDVAPGSGPGGNNYQVGWNYAGEWYKYTVNATQTGTYTATFQYSAGGPGGTFHLEDENGRTLTGPLTAQNTYNWSTYYTITSPPFTLLQGPHTLKLVDDANGPNWYVCNFDDFTIAPTQPNNGPHNVPGTIQSDDYDKGGEGVGYHLAPPATPQAGTGYRADNNTHIYAENAPGGNGYVLGWSDASDWYDYSVNVTTAANYTATFQVQTGGPGGTFHLEDENHNNLTGSISAPDTGGWGSAYWKTVTSPAFALTAGPHILHLAEDTVVAGGWVCDFSWMQLAVVSGAPITGTEFDDGAGPWGGNQANVASNAFDGAIATFYDCNSAYGYVGIDAGVPTTVSSIVYAPRAGSYESRMVGGVFEGSNTSPTAGYVTLGTVTATPTDGLTNTITVTNAAPYRWLRYRDSQGGDCNVAEIQFIDPPVGVPAVPTGSKAAAGAVGTKKVTLTWSAASGATSYHILRSLASGYTGTKAQAVNVTGLSYTDSGLTAGTTYYYKITAVNSKGGSIASAQVSAAAK